MCVGRWALCRWVCGQRVHHMALRGLEPRTLRLLAVRSNQLSYETLDVFSAPAELSCQEGGSLIPRR